MHEVHLSQLSLSPLPNLYSVKHIEPNVQWVQDLRQIPSKFLAHLAMITLFPIAISIFWDITVPAKCDLIITSLILYNISSSKRFVLFFELLFRNICSIVLFNLIFELFFLCIYCCSLERKLCVNIWNTMNRFFSSVNRGIITNLFPYFWWAVFIVAFSQLFLYFLLYKLDLCFTCDI